MSSSNIEKIKALSAQLSTKEEKDNRLKRDCVNCLEKIYNMLCKPRVNKEALKDEVMYLMNKLDHKENF